MILYRVAYCELEHNYILHNFCPPGNAPGTPPHLIVEDARPLEIAPWSIYRLRLVFRRCSLRYSKVNAQWF